MALNRVIAGLTATALTAFSAQESNAARKIDCNAVHEGLSAEYVTPPPGQGDKLGKVLKLIFSDEAFMATGINSIVFSLPASKITVATPKPRKDGTDENLSIYWIEDAYKRPRPGPQMNQHGLECMISEDFFFSCARAQEYTPSLQGDQPNTIFGGGVKYKLGPVPGQPVCEGTVFAPALQK